MELTVLQKNIKENNLDKFYVFAGEETGIMKQYIKMISEKSGMEIESVDNVSAAVQRISKSGLVHRSKLYVVIDDKSFMKAENNWSRLPKLIKSDILVLLYTKVDKRSKFFKSVDFVAFNPMNADVLSRRISSLSSLTIPEAKMLAEICSCSYDRCLLELDKIKAYTEIKSDENWKDSHSFHLLLNENLIYKEESECVFQLVDSILSRNNVKQIEKLLIKFKRNKEPVLLACTLLYNRFRALLMYQELTDKSTAEQSAGLTKFEIYNCKRDINNYTTSELIRALKLIQFAEQGVKIGTIEENIVIDYIIAEIV